MEVKQAHEYGKRDIFWRKKALKPEYIMLLADTPSPRTEQLLNRNARNSVLVLGPKDLLCSHKMSPKHKL